MVVEVAEAASGGVVMEKQSCAGALEKIFSKSLGLLPNSGSRSARRELHQMRAPLRRFNSYLLVFHSRFSAKNR
jgi:CHAD domain-containing protein